MGYMYKISSGDDENALEFGGGGCIPFEYTEKKIPLNCILLKGKFYGVQIRSK